MVRVVRQRARQHPGVSARAQCHDCRAGAAAALSSEPGRDASPPDESRRAYDLYLHGRHFWYQLNPAGTRSAIEYFQRATALDPEYALAWSGLSDAYASSPVNGDGDPRIVWPKAQDAAGRAMRLAPDMAEAQTSRGFLKFWMDWDWPGAEQAYLRAIELDPNYPLAHRMFGVVRSHMGRHAEAEGPMRRARELDPLYAMHHALSAQLAYAGRDFAAAARWARRRSLWIRFSGLRTGSLRRPASRWDSRNRRWKRWRMPRASATTIQRPSR